MIENIGNHYLYRHIRLDTGEPFYIGVGTKNNRAHNSISHEYSRAYSKSDRSDFWKNITNKSAYEVEILLESDDYEFVKQKEIEFVALYGRRNLRRGSLCNLTDGGEGMLGIIVSNETRAKQSKAHKGKKRTGEALLNLQKSAKEVVDRYAKERIGEHHITNQACKLKIIGYDNSQNCTIQFEDGTIVKNIKYSEIVRGCVDNPNRISVNGLGYFGQGEYKRFKTSGKNEKYYTLWLRLLNECSEEGINICEEWKCFQNFAEWYCKKCKDGFMFSRFIAEQNTYKTYSPETCCFVPYRIHNLLSIIVGKDGLPTGVQLVGKRYRAQITINRKPIHIGMYDTPKEASDAYNTVRESELDRLCEEYINELEVHVYDALHKYKNNQLN